MKRSPSFPEVPTVDESGYPGYDASLWLGFIAPTGTPKPIVDRLHKELTAIVAMPETQTALRANGAEPITNTPDAFAALIKDEVGKYVKAVKAAGMKPL
jgi:tripartite-type tricarboxylate transporter receptor subunit TctC